MNPLRSLATNVLHIYFSCGIVQNKASNYKLRLQTQNKHLINPKATIE